MKTAAFILLLFFSHSAYANIYPVVPGQRCVIDGDVYYSYEDSMSFADVKFEQRGWPKQKIDTNLNPFGDKTGFAWYRIPLHFTAPAGEPLSLFIPLHCGSSEIFINGVRLYPPSESSQKFFALGCPSLVRIPVSAVTGNGDVLSVRIRFNDFYCGFFEPLVIDTERNSLRHFVLYLIRYASFFFICIFIALFILLIFTGRTRSVFYLYFSLLAMAVGIWVAGIKGLPLYLLNHRIVFYCTSYLSSVLIVIFEILFIKSFFGIKKNHFLDILAGFYAFIFCELFSELLFTGRILFYQKYIYSPFIFSLMLSQFALLFFTAKLILRKEQYSVRIFAGIACIALPGAMMVLYYLDRPLIPFEPPVIEGFFSTVIIFSTVLASRYAGTFNQLEKANTELLVLDKLKDDFLAITSHELRTPLTGIIALSEGIALEKLDDEQRHSVDLIKKSAQHLNSLVNDILDFSKINAGKADLYITEFDLVPTIMTVVSLLSPSAKEKNIDLKVEPCSDSVIIRADQRRIRQILINLVGNAVKFTESGSVLVRTRHSSNTIAVDVIDTGRGIAGDKLKVIFLPFEQAADVSTREQSGTGLGLAVARRLAELHGGTIEVESRPGEGSTFTLVLSDNLGVQGIERRGYLGVPALVSFSEGMAALSKQQNFPDVRWDESGSSPRAELSGPSFQKSLQYSAHILIVDDDPINLWTASSLCRKYGHTVSTAKNGAEALAALEGEPVELVLLDLMLPGMSGYEVCAKIREIYSERFIPVIIMTAHGDGSSEMMRGFECGANDYLAKPFDVKVLMMRIENQLAIKHMLDMEKTIVNGLRRECDSVTNLAQRSAVLRDFTLQMSAWESIIQEDLDIASQFQTKLMNRSRIEGLDYSLFYQPILRIGGDVYDIFEVKPGLVRVLLADATGHGINASLNTVKILSEYAAIKSIKQSPGEIIRHMNGLFHKTFEDYQIIFTCIIADIDLNENQLRVSMAGHIEQLIVTPAGPVPLKIRGPIIGLKEDSFYEEQVYSFVKGSSLVLFSDGLFDIFESDDPFWGTLSLFSTDLVTPLRKDRSLSAAQIVDNILPEKRRVRFANQQDDVTLLVLHRE